MSKLKSKSLPRATQSRTITTAPPGVSFVERPKEMSPEHMIALVQSGVVTVPLLTIAVRELLRTKSVILSSDRHALQAAVNELNVL